MARTPLGSEELAREARSISAMFPGYPPPKNDLQVNDFTVIGSGSYRVALLGPDQVVYKAPFGVQDLPEHFTEELELFDTASRFGKPWAPDYWPYEDVQVMAMPRYEPLKASKWWVIQENEVAHLMLDIELSSSDVRRPNLGWAPDGRLILLDGGRSYAYRLWRHEMDVL